VRALTPLAVIAAATTALHATPAPADMIVVDGEMAPMPMPKFPRPPAGPPPQVSAFATPRIGTMTCRGVANGRTVKGTMTAALVLGDAWLRITMSWSDGETSSTMVEHRTFDVIAKQWVRIVIGPGTARATQTSLGGSNDVWKWTAEGTAAETQRASSNGFEIRRDGLALTCSR
jgi:hypothetical protein